MLVNGVAIDDTFAEAFPMKATRLIITAHDVTWARHAAVSMTGFATSVIACGCEAGIETELDPTATPDGRPGIAVQYATAGLTQQHNRILELPFEYRDVVREIAGIIGVHRPIISVPPGIGYAVSKLINPFVGDVIITRFADDFVVGFEHQGDAKRFLHDLRERFGLTAAEAALALEIVKGDGRQAAAGRLGITVGTARSHLTRIFDKTGVRHQAELVRLLLQK